MKNIVFLLFVALFINGCSSTSTVAVLTPSYNNASQEEMRQAAQAAVKDVVNDARFAMFLRKYRQEKNDPNAVPILKVDKLYNNTDNPDLYADEMISTFTTSLMKANKIQLTAAEGELRISAIRHTEQAQSGKRVLLQPARLVLRLKISSFTTMQNGKRVSCRNYAFDMADVENGTIVWRFTKQFGTVAQ